MDKVTQAEWDDSTTEEQWEYVQVLEKLLYSRDRLLKLIPECPMHGEQCVSHALKWIEHARKAVGDE